MSKVPVTFNSWMYFVDNEPDQLFVECELPQVPELEALVQSARVSAVPIDYYWQFVKLLNRLLIVDNTATP